MELEALYNRTRRVRIELGEISISLNATTLTKRIAES